MFAVLASAIYGIFEKRVKTKPLLTFCYFLSMGLIWTAFTLLLSLLIAGRDLILGRANPEFFKLVPFIGFLLGEVFAFFPWITGLRNSDEDPKGE